MVYARLNHSPGQVPRTEDGNPAVWRYSSFKACSSFSLVALFRCIRPFGLVNIVIWKSQGWSQDPIAGDTEEESNDRYAGRAEDDAIGLWRYA